jgi:hypothetical protein
MSVPAAKTGPAGLGSAASVPLMPNTSRTVLRNPLTKEVVIIDKWSVFWMTFFFGFFYMAYKQVWLHAGITLVLAWVTFGLSWFIYPFMMYGIMVDTYRKKGWVVVPQPIPQPQPHPSVV